MSDTDLVVDDRIQKMIWKSLGRKSARQIAQETGLSIEQVAYVRTQLLESVDELTIRERKTKLLVELQEISDQAREDYKNADDTDSGSKLLQVSVGAIKTVLEQLNRMEKQDDSKVEALNALRVRELLKLVDSVVGATLRDVASISGLDEEDLWDIFQGHLIPEANRLESEA